MNSLLVAERRGRIDPDGAAFAVHLYQQIEMLIDPWTSSHAMGTSYFLAVKHRLTLYDAAYLELALRLGHPLATLDQKLAKAAEEEGVEVVRIES
jgi:predicted nucleic acid-binding protein